MTLLFIILAVVLALGLVLLAATLKIIFTFNSDRTDMNLTLSLFYPFLKAVITNESGLILTVYLLNKSIFTRELKPGDSKPGKMDLIKRVRPTDINVYTSYGFRDPAITGVACGAIGIASQFFNIRSLYQDPDFVSDNDYIYVNASAKLKIWSALVNIYRAYAKRSVE